MNYKFSIPIYNGTQMPLTNYYQTMDSIFCFVSTIDRLSTLESDPLVLNLLRYLLSDFEERIRPFDRLTENGNPLPEKIKLNHLIEASSTITFSLHVYNENLSNINLIREELTIELMKIVIDMVSNQGGMEVESWK